VSQLFRALSLRGVAKLRWLFEGKLGWSIFNEIRE
jgi:hypothetical protein